VEKAKIHQQLKILNSVFLNCNIDVLLPVWFGCMGLCIVMGVCGGILLHSLVSIFDKMVFMNMSVNGFFILFGLLHFAGNIPLESGTLIYQLHDESFRITRQQRLSIRALKIFGIRCNPIRVLKHNALGIYLIGIQNYIMSILLTHPTAHSAH